MKKKDLTKLREKSLEELSSMVSEKRKEIDNSFSKMKAGQEKNLKAVRNKRQDIAQILTIAKEKKLVKENTLKEEK